MLSSSWLSHFRSFFRPQGRTYCRIRRIPALESLEVRLAPATFTWDGGGGVNHKWSDGANWMGNAAPKGLVSSLDDLVFPAGASTLTSINDLSGPGAGVLPTFKSITISGSHSSISGLPLTLGDPSSPGSGGITVCSGTTNDTLALNGIRLGAVGTEQAFTVGLNGQLTISSPLSGSAGAQLTKQGSGILILTANNSSFTGTTTVAAGILDIEDSNALGNPTTATATVQNNATLQLDVDNIPDSVTGNTKSLHVSVPLTLTGSGFNGIGALNSNSGINIYSGSISLTGNDAAISVEPDPNESNTSSYFTNDYSLTITGSANGIAGTAATTLQKIGTGQLILPSNNNAFLGPVDIQAGWVTIRSQNALGFTQPSPINQNNEPTTTVEEGAALHLYPANGGHFTLYENFVLNGSGFSHPFSQISNRSAIENLVGINTLAGNIQLNNQVGIGVEKTFGASQLTSTGTVSQTTLSSGSASGGSGEFDDIIDTGSTHGIINISFESYAYDDLRVYYPPIGQPGSTLILNANTGEGTFLPYAVNYGPGSSTQVEITVNEGRSGGGLGTSWAFSDNISLANGGITKLGSQLLILEGPGSYTGPVDIQQGAILDQNDTGLGEGAALTSVTTVESGAALLLANDIASLNGGIQYGVNDLGENLVLNGPGNNTLLSGGIPLAPLTVQSDNSLGFPANDPLAPTVDGVVWNGPVTLKTNVAISVPQFSQLFITGIISGADLNKIGGGELILSAAFSSFSGATISGGNLLDETNFPTTVTLAGGTLSIVNAYTGYIDIVTTAGTSSTISIAPNESDPGAIQYFTSLTMAPGSTLNIVPDPESVANQPYTVSFQYTDVSGTDSFNVDNNGKLTLGSLNDSCTATTLVKTGAGTLAMRSAANSLVNGTPVNVKGGILSTNTAAALGSGTVLTISSGASLDLGGDQTVGALLGSGNILLNGHTLTLDTTSYLTGAFSGIIADGSAAGSLVKAGPGTQTLSGVNTYTGTTTISGGILTLCSGGVLNNSNVVAGGAVLLNAPGVTLNGSGTIKGRVTVAASNTSITGVTITVTLSGTGITVAPAATSTQINGVTINGGTSLTTGILVKGSAAILNSNISGHNVDVNVNGGIALLQGDTLGAGTGLYASGLLAQNGAIVDAGQVSSANAKYGNFTGLGISTGGNSFIGYTASTSTGNPTVAQAIRDLNSGGAYALSGPQYGKLDLTAENDTFGTATTLATIEQLIFHDKDNNAYGYVNYGE